jgi:hypothetical protein
VIAGQALSSLSLDTSAVKEPLHRYCHRAHPKQTGGSSCKVKRLLFVIAGCQENCLLSPSSYTLSFYFSPEGEV